MHTSRDWIAEENALAALFEADIDGSHRAEILARLYDYARAVVAEARRVGLLRSEHSGGPLDWLARPIFICGHHRSGTSLLHRLLDGHPQLVVLPGEATYFDAFRDVARADPSPDALDHYATEWIARFVDPNFTPHFRLGRASLDRVPSVEFVGRLFGWLDALRDARPERLRALFALLAAYADVVPHGEPLAWMEKTPLNEFHIHEFERIPAARFIHVLRHPEHVLASMRQAYVRDGRGELFDPTSHAARLGRSMEAALRNSGRLGKRYLLIKYEDLTADTAAQMERVREFLGIDPSPSMEIPTSDGMPVAPNTSFEPGRPGVVRAARNAIALEKDERRMVDVFAGDAAREFGYPLPRTHVLGRAMTRTRHALPIARAFAGRWKRYWSAR
jgi:hypothetical protein